MNRNSGSYPKVRFQKSKGIMMAEIATKYIITLLRKHTTLETMTQVELQELARVITWNWFKV